MQYTRLQRGIGDLFGSLLNVNKNYQSSFDEGYRDAAQAGAYRATARDRYADAALKESRLGSMNAAREIGPEALSGYLARLLPNAQKRPEQSPAELRSPGAAPAAPAGAYSGPPAGGGIAPPEPMPGQGTPPMVQAPQVPGNGMAGGAYDPSSLGALITHMMLASGSPNVEQMAGALQTLQRMGYLPEAAGAIGAGQMDQAAALNALSTGGQVPDMYSQNAAGQVLGNFTGETGQTPLSRSATIKNLNTEPKLQEIYDPTSPTGTRLVSMGDAAGMPGKPSKNGVSITGYDEEGRPLISVGGSGSGLGTAGMNQVDKKLLNAGDTLSQITSIRSKFRPEFQQLGTRLGAAWSQLKSKAGAGDVTPDERQLLQDLAKYRAEAGQLFALTLKDLSGVAVNPTEFKRAEAWLPNPGTGIFDGDDPISLEAKLDRFEDFTRKALMKHAYIQRHGLTVNDVDVDAMPTLMQRRGDEIATELQRQGVSGDSLKMAVKQRLADEFGLVAF